MRQWGLRLCAALLGLGGAACFGQMSINPGTLLAGSVTAAKQTDVYTLNATAGDVITLRATKASGEIWPRLVVRDPANIVMSDVSQSQTVDLQFVPSVSGLIRVYVSDGFSGNLLGDYTLYAQVNNRPGGAAQIDPGQTAVDQAIPRGGFATYSISLQAGDVVTCRASQISGSIWPLIRLHDPTGWLVDSGSSQVTAEVTRSASSTGQYTILVGDGYNGSFSGATNLFVQVVNRPGAAVAVEHGLTRSSSIDNPAAMRTFSIQAATGDVIFARMTRQTGTLWPMMRLYDPNGMLLRQESTSVSTDLTQTVSVTGNHTLLVGDGYNGTYIGPFSLFTQSLTHPNNGAELGQTQSLTGSIAGSGEMKTYTVTMPPASPSLLSLRVTRSTGTMWPLIRLYDAYGNKLAEASGSTTAAISPVVRPTRSYTALVGDGFNGVYTGGYTLYWNFTVPDVVLALRAAGGQLVVKSADIARLNQATAAPSDAKIDLLDVVAIARSAWGL